MMGGFSSLEVVYIALIFIVPGFIIRSVRSQFIIEQDRTGVDQFVRLLTYSSVSNALGALILYIIFPYEALFDNKILVWSALILLFPLAYGVLSGAASQKQWLYKAFCAIGLKPIHTVPNAWDYKFAQTGGEWVCVTLKDNTKIAGWWAGGSFASSDSKERDILIEQVFEIDGSHPWKPTNKSVLITGGEIKRIEFQKPI